MLTKVPKLSTVFIIVGHQKIFYHLGNVALFRCSSNKFLVDYLRERYETHKRAEIPEPPGTSTTECAEVNVHTRYNRLYSAVLLRTSSYSYCRTFRTPTTQYCIMILARRGHQTALVQYVETYEWNSGSRKTNPCVRKIFELMFSAWKGRFHVQLAMFLRSAHGFSMGSAWISTLSTWYRR